MEHVAQHIPVQQHTHPSLLHTLLALTKVRITFAVTLTTATGFLLATRAWDWHIWLPMLGTFLLASGSSAMNEWQESHIDARMRRTRPRPIPAGHIDPTIALFFSIFLMLIGMYVLTSNRIGSYDLFFLGLLAVVWYNGIYTYLKRVTAFAVVPGAVIGAIPPVIGYVAGGGQLFDSQILMVASFFFLWQIPHFWLIVLMIGDEYRHAGLPTLTDVFEEPQIKRITIMWLLATAASGTSFTLLSEDVYRLTLPWNAIVIIASMWLAQQAFKLLNTDKVDRLDYRRTFMQTNLYALVIILALTLSATTPL